MASGNQRTTISVASKAVNSDSDDNYRKFESVWFNFYGSTEIFPGGQSSPFKTTQTQQDTVH